MTKYQALFQQFQEAVRRFEDVLKEPKTEFIRDSAIKRFELAFDLSWKTIKAFLEEEGLLCTSPLDCFREAFRQGLLRGHDSWAELVRTRNKTVHTYSAALAEEVYQALPGALAAFQELLTTLGNRNSSSCTKATGA